MASTVQGKQDSHLRIVSSEDAVVFPENATPSDDAPTVISKNVPLLEGSNTQKKNQLAELSRQSMSPETLVASLRGRRLAHYELIEPIGVGGMAAVIRARDTQLDRFVALKILPPEMALEIENIQRFHQEAKAAAKLDHENIARVFFCGEDQGLHFIAFEFVEGINLRALLERRGLLPVGEAIRYVVQIAAGLEHAASRGVVHRDVKPSNIIITPTGRAKLVDMGLARNLERHGERDLTQSGVTLGTFDYISPEQALEPREADSRSDVYSLGCTLYHMLTGHPPVPDGTPAKKLNHHQHIAPVDPRLINPKIPDEIVQVLGKMMAKNPKDRYQRPILLVNHLMQIAQKCGAGSEMSDGVLFLDAPVPTPVRSRPLLVIGLALVSLVAVILLLSLVPDPRPTPNGDRPIVDKDKKPDPPNLDLAKGAGKNNAPPGVHTAVVGTTTELDTALTNRVDAVVNAKIEGSIELHNSGLTYKGLGTQRLEIDSNDPNSHAMIRFVYQRGGATAGLAIDGGEEVVFRRIRFQIEYAFTPEKDIQVAAVAVRGVKRIRFEQCLFTETGARPMTADRTPLSSILIDTGDSVVGPAPVVIVRNCGFEGNGEKGGQVAIAVNGPVTFMASSCGFKPHGALFHIRNKSSAANTSISMQRCSSLVGEGPVFWFDRQASATLKPELSVFSRPEGSLATNQGLPQPDLISCEEKSDKVQITYLGRKNLYHNLNALVGYVNNASELINKAPAFQTYLKDNKGRDDSRYLEQSPWQAAQPLNDKTALAFQLKAEYYKEDIGIETSWLGTKLPAPPVPLLAKIPPSMPKTKTVDPDDFGGTAGVFMNLASALSAAVDGDVILIKHGDNPNVKAPPIIIRPGISVTLKPFDENYRPMLVIDPDYKFNDSCLFKVPTGKLAFESLDVLLDPGNLDLEVHSIVQLGEGAQCAFKDCKITLRPTGKVKLNAVTFLDVATMAKVENPPPPARIEFSECFVRGRGDLVNLRGSQLVHVDVRNSLVVLAGQLLDVVADGKTVSPDRAVSWDMDRTSVYTSESVFALRSDMPKGLSKTQAKVNGCLFAALVAEQLFVPEMGSEDDLRMYLDWQPGKNYYAGFAEMGMWKQRYPEPTSVIEPTRLMFPKLSEDDPAQNLWDITPDMLKPSDADTLKRLSEFGIPADIEQRWMPSGEKTDDP